MISMNEKQKRTDAINFAMGSIRLEGSELPKEIKEINQQFIDGLIDNEQHSKLVIEFVDQM